MAFYTPNTTSLVAPARHFSSGKYIARGCLLLFTYLSVAKVLIGYVHDIVFIVGNILAV